MKPVRTAAAIALAATASLGVGVAPAQAHTTLQNADPGIDSTVSPPSKIVLTYADPVRLPQVILTTASGARVVLGRPFAVDNVVTTQLRSELPNGSYTVGWRVVAVDGHPVEGTYRFTVVGSSTTAAPATVPAGKPQSAARSSSTTIWWIGLGGLLVVAVAAGVVLLRRSLSTDE